jgi:hypothetical protein
MSAFPGTTVTLTLPEAVYRQAQAAAREAHRSIREVLTDVLTEAFPAVYVSPDRVRMAEEELAFDRLQDELLARYEGQYVAIHGAQVIDNDPDEMALAARTAERHPGQVVHIRRVCREPEVDLSIRSPRWVD